MTLMFDSGLISWGEIICWSVLGFNGIKEEPSSIKVNDSKIKPIFSVHQELFLFCLTLFKDSHGSIMVVFIAKLIFILLLCIVFTRYL